MSRLPPIDSVCELSITVHSVSDSIDAVVLSVRIAEADTRWHDERHLEVVRTDTVHISETDTQRHDRKPSHARARPRVQWHTSDSIPDSVRVALRLLTHSLTSMLLWLVSLRVACHAAFALMPFTPRNVTGGWLQTTCMEIFVLLMCSVCNGVHCETHGDKHTDT